MIKCYTGVPGAGKSLHVIQKAVAYLRRGKNVIANFPLKVDEVKKNKGHYYYVSNDDLSVDYLMQFARTMHREREEGQTLILVDEASVKFNARRYMDEDRLPFLSFFAQHRKYGYEIILVQQSLGQIDKQVREMVEIEVLHRKLNNYAWFWIVPFPIFVAIERNVSVRQKNSHEFFLYSKKYGELYDTFFEFDNQIIPEHSDALQIMIEESEIQPQAVKNSGRRRRRGAGVSQPLPTAAPAEPDGLGQEVTVETTKPSLEDIAKFLEKCG